MKHKQDVAFLFLETELNGPQVSRAATREEIEDFRLGRGRAFHLGYGCIGQSYEQRKNNDGRPFLANEIMGTKQGSLSTPIWDRFLLAQYDMGKGEVCSGDSGSPLLMKKDDEVIYLGTIFAGGGSGQIKYAATTVLWPFVPALEKALAEFMIEDTKRLEIKAKQEAENKAINDKATADKIIQDARLEAERIIQEAKLEAENILMAARTFKKRTTTITCIKGKMTKKVTAEKPTCPAGYKKK